MSPLQSDYSDFITMNQWMLAHPRITLALSFAATFLLISSAVLAGLQAHGLIERLLANRGRKIPVSTSAPEANPRPAAATHQDSKPPAKCQLPDAPKKPAPDPESRYMPKPVS